MNAPRCDTCKFWTTEAASGIFYCTHPMCRDSQSLIKRSDTGKWYTVDEIIEDRFLAPTVRITDCNLGDEEWRSLESFTVIQDSHGFWAKDDTGFYTVDVDKYDKPYLCVAPVYTDSDEPHWDNELEWGEPSFGQIEAVDEAHLKRVERILISSWNSLGKPRTHAMEQSEKYDAEQAAKKSAEQQGLQNFTYLVTLAATGEEEAKSFLLGCHANIREVDRAVDQSGKWFVDEAEQKDYTECPGDPECTADKGPYGMTYAHAHCAIDGCVLMAIGGGGDDGRGVDGYEDRKGNTAIIDPEYDELASPECMLRKYDRPT